MNAMTAGVLLALLVAGYPLYELVTTGALDPDTALVRGAIVAAACAAGVAAVVHLALGYEQADENRKRRRLNNLFSDMEGAVAEGTLQDEEAAATPAPAEGTSDRTSAPGGPPEAH